MEGNTYEQSLQSERLNSASYHINTNWLPLNLKLLEEIYGKLEKNYYENRKDELIQDLKGDLALFTFSIKEIALTSKSDLKSIFQSIKECEVEKLKKIIEKSRELASVHNLKSSSEQQLNQLKANLSSCAISETIAETLDVEAETVFVCALFRQIGLTFIAWNYPHFFEAALKASNNEEEFLKHLNQSLGFSAALLGIRLAKEWQIPSQVIRIMDLQEKEAGLSETKTEQQNETIIKLCRIGELLASLSNENYPDKEQAKWNHARNEILKHLGSQGFKIIDQSIAKICGYYQNLLPHFSNKLISRQIEEYIKPSSSASLFHCNPYIKFLTIDVQNELRSFYDLITPELEGLSKDSISILQTRLVPVMGFKLGALYLIDPTSNTLHARLAFGRAKVNDFPDINILAYENSSSPFVRAFSSTSPIVKRNDLKSDILYFCGALGSLQRAGVLYLEPEEWLCRDDKINPVLYFRAILRAMEDCLSLR